MNLFEPMLIIALISSSLIGLHSCSDQIITDAMGRPLSETKMPNITVPEEVWCKVAKYNEFGWDKNEHNETNP